jgi:hypothetical protein
MYDCPTLMEVTIEYENPDLTIVWRQPGEKPVDYDYGAIYHGTDDTLIVRGGDGGTFTEEKAMNCKPGRGRKHAYVSPGHHLDWFEAIKTGKKPIMDIESSHRIATMCILANISYRIGRPIEWDGERQRIIDDEAANFLLGSAGRGEWHL